MNGLALSGVGVLMQDGDCRPVLGLDDPSSCHDGDIGNLVVINASDIASLIRFLYDTDIITSNATVGTSVDQQTYSPGLVGGD